MCHVLRKFLLSSLWMVSLSFISLSCGMCVVPPGSQEWTESFEKIKTHWQLQIDATQETLDAHVEILLRVNVEQIKSNISSMLEVITDLEEIKQERLSIDHFLGRLLEARLFSLNQRKGIMELAFKHQSFVQYGPTYPEVYSGLSKSNKSLARYSTDLYQSRNIVILELLRLADLSQLSEETKRLIACSPALWDLIKQRIAGLEPDPGHTDECIISSDYKTFKMNSDPDLYNLHFLQHSEKTFEVRGRKVRRIIPLKIPDFLLKSTQQPIDFQQKKPSSQKKIVKKESTDSQISAPTVSQVEETSGGEDYETYEEKTGTFPQPQQPVSGTTIPSRARNLKAEATQDPRQLSTRQHNTLLDIFAKPYQCKVTFSAFESLWKALGGNILGYQSGGSHRTLKNAAGVTVGGIFVPHGASNTYGQHTIKYLKEALRAIGVEI